MTNAHPNLISYSVVKRRHGLTALVSTYRRSVDYLGGTYVEVYDAMGDLIADERIAEPGETADAEVQASTVNTLLDACES